ncbi:LOW QUALITY PROTEIN: Hypothetical protein PHPALM_4897 [Phytophthora palmivora]|uniref:Uncharacterized protein n=1 Tax=Phytophthora palmivora TaxID=4796 RepID=A0A2P4YIT2_9STRA|nr:LOW QUALITY PROTEIN: Hypothetical protein PHPALM_4897 [Phytophthora palmivora]
MVVMRQPYPVHLLRSSALFTKLLPMNPDHNRRKAVYLEPVSGSYVFCDVGLAFPGAPPISDGTLHVKVKLDIPIKKSRRSRHLEFDYEARSPSLPSGLPPSVLDDLRQLRDRIHAFEIALTLSLAAATQPGKPTGLDVLRQDVNALDLEVQELHKRIDGRVPASALKELRWSHDAPAYEDHDQMPSYEPRGYSYHST